MRDLSAEICKSDTGTIKLDQVNVDPNRPVLVKSVSHRIEGLDELRGLAILSVLVAHFFELREADVSLANFNLGGIGVDLFFLISGYLITFILCKDIHRPNGFRRFYVRRAFRILPLFVVVETAAVFISLVTGKTLSGLPFYLSFTQNLLAESPPIGDLLPPQYVPVAGLGPTWSLAVEEHCYLLLPLVIFVLNPKYLSPLFCVISILAIYLHAQQSAPFVENDTGWIYVNPKETWLRVQHILLGGLLAMPRPLTYLAAIFVCWVAVVVRYPFMYLHLLIGLGLVAVVWACVKGRPLIRNVLLARVGVLCYGIYLLHVFVLIAVKQLPIAPGFQFAALCVLSWLFAECSFRFFEMPIQRRRIWFESASTTKLENETL